VYDNLRLDESSDLTSPWQSANLKWRGEASKVRRVYLDNNATTPLAPEVFEAMKPYLLEDFGNASSIHWFGQQAKNAVEKARQQVAKLLNARPGEVIFTSGGTESDNAALFGIVQAARVAAPHVITTGIEHHAVLNTAQALEKQGVSVTYLGVGAGGVIDPEDVKHAIRPETVLISIMHANNEIGTIQPLEEIGSIARERDIYFHSDAVQAVGKIPVDVEKLGADLLSLSAHKFNGPKGAGAMYIRRGTILKPLLYGGHHERDRRPGTENVPGIVGLGMAAELALAHLEENAQRVACLRDRLERGILERVAQVSVNGDPQRRLPNTSNLAFDYLEGEGFVIAMDLRGIACSTGAACSSGAVEPSHVLSAIGRTPDQARSSVRLSLGRYTTAEDIDAALEALPTVVERLRSLSPRWAQGNRE
jgi:cysteine desulfurase